MQSFSNITQVMCAEFRFELEVEPSSVPTMPPSLSQSANVPPTLAASREALGIAGVPDAAIAGEASVEAPRTSRRLQPLVQRSDSARLNV